MDQDKNNSFGWYVVIGIIVIAVALSGDDKTEKTDSSSTSSYVDTYNTSTIYEDYSEDGYDWAEQNDIDNFEGCQYEFGTSYEEDECNRYVQENYTSYESFGDYDCTEDCSGHEAGYDWAEENDIYDEYDCDGNSNSFNEGCLSYVEENY